VIPCTREATLVHMVDNLGGRLGSFDRIEKSLGDGERWSGYDRGISGSAYFGEREGAVAAGEADEAGARAA
jgi:3'-5' exoribonuclease